VRQLPASRRREVAGALQQALNQPGFEPNDYERRYTVPGLGDRAYAGASLVALDKVLKAFADRDETPADETA
jgi:hypothetical protein